MGVGAADFGCAARGSVKTEDEGNTELEALELVELEDFEMNGAMGVTVAETEGTLGAAFGLAAWRSGSVAAGGADGVLVSLSAGEAATGATVTAGTTGGGAGTAAGIFAGAEFGAAATGAAGEPLAGAAFTLAEAGAEGMPAVATRSLGKRMPQKPTTGSVNSSST